MLFFTFFNCIFSIAGNRAAGTVHYFFKECSVFIQQLLFDVIEVFYGSFFGGVVKMFPGGGGDAETFFDLK